MGKSVFTKIGTLKVKNGTYTKDNTEHTRWHEVGVLLSSPHGSNMFIKLHATATSEPKLISIFKDENIEFTLTERKSMPEPDTEPANQDQILSEDIQF